MGAPRPNIPLDLDGDEQRMFRRVLDPLFAPKAVAALEPVVRRVTDELIDAFIDKGEVELFEALCQPTPSIIFVDLLGLPASDLPVFTRFKESVVHPEGDTVEARREFQAREGQIITDYLNRVCDEREAASDLGEGIVAGFLRTEIEGRRLSRTEIVDIVYLLIIAGLDTVVSSLSLMFSWFARNPEQRDRLVADPSLLPSAVEELLRYESPVMRGSRWVTESFSLNGWDFAPGEEVDILWASANVDPEAFDNPLTVDLDRSRNAHVGFASGPHRCLGSNLARMELRVVIEQFHRRIPNYWITPGAEPQYYNNGVRAAYHLPISFRVGG